MTDLPHSGGSSPPPIAPDGRQSAAALDIARGVGRVLREHAMAYLTELPLANNRRADMIGISPAGDLWIIEIKSSIEDFQADQKWAEYRDFSDAFYFAVSPTFPRDLIPTDAGLIIADRYGGEIMRRAPTHRLSPARRKAVQLRFARAAALRLAAASDPSVAAALAAVDL